MKALPYWLGSLSSLQKLSLRYCNNLMYLPMFHLTKSKHLRIADCPNLEKRCVEGSGEEWFQISHIPNIKINGKYIQGKDFEDSEDFDIFDDSEDDRDDYNSINTLFPIYILLREANWSDHRPKFKATVNFNGEELLAASSVRAVNIYIGYKFCISS